MTRLAPKGIDIYYDNVGSETLEAAIDSLNWFGRIVACGFISQYNNAGEKYGVKNLDRFFEKRLLMQGFIVGDQEFGPAYFAEHQKNVQRWIKEGSFKPLTHQTDGIDHSIEGLLNLYLGKNLGKAVLKF